MFVIAQYSLLSKIYPAIPPSPMTRLASAVALLLCAVIGATSPSLVAAAPRGSFHLQALYDFVTQDDPTACSVVVDSTNNATLEYVGRQSFTQNNMTYWVSLCNKQNITLGSDNCAGFNFAATPENAQTCADLTSVFDVVGPLSFDNESKTIDVTLTSSSNVNKQMKVIAVCDQSGAPFSLLNYTSSEFFSFMVFNSSTVCPGYSPAAASNGLSTGAIIGIVVGAVLVAVVIGAVCYRRSQMSSTSDTNVSNSPYRAMDKSNPA
mgnify:CR=1 FL=1